MNKNGSKRITSSMADQKDCQAEDSTSTFRIVNHFIIETLRLPNET